jgi:hypothetical protein
MTHQLLAHEERATPDLRKGFILRCPNDHDVDPIFDLTTLETSLDRRHVQSFCFRCGQEWQLSPADQSNLLDWLNAQTASR